MIIKATNILSGQIVVGQVDASDPKHEEFPPNDVVHGNPFLYLDHLPAVRAYLLEKAENPFLRLYHIGTRAPHTTWWLVAHPDELARKAKKVDP